MQIKFQLVLLDWFGRLRGTTVDTYAVRECYLRIEALDYRKN